MNRREFLCAAASLPLAASAAPASARIDRTRISAITDEIAASEADSIAFAHKYGLKWLELRDVPGVKGANYFLMEEADAKASARQFASNGIGISFLNANLLKFGLPGTEPLRRTPEAPEAKAKRIAREQDRFDHRLSDLRRSIRCAQIFECPYVRVFAFSRVEGPRKLYSRIADILGEFATIAEKEGVTLLIEQEASCNVGTSAELAVICGMLPSKAIGVNWDSLNGLALDEKPFPDGYQALPKARVRNVQIKGKSVLDYPEKLDWRQIFRALEQDGYRGQIGLETHIFDDRRIEHSHQAMQEILRILGENRATS